MSGISHLLGQVHHAEAVEFMRGLPEGFVQCVVTSPPYWGLRDYGTAQWEGGNAGCDHKYQVKSPLNEGFNERCGNSPGQKKQESWRHEVSYKNSCSKCGARRIDQQLGLERVPDCLGWATGNPCGECFICKMVAVFREVRRVLRDDGVCFVNMGDSYNGSGPSGGPGKQYTNKGSQDTTTKKVDGLKPKDLCGIPWRVAFALQADGWWLRQDIIWHKPNPMPESVTDRCTKAHEYLFLLTKSERYYWDQEAIKEESITNDPRRPYTSNGAWELDGRPIEQRHGGKVRSPAGWKTGKGSHGSIHDQGREQDISYTENVFAKRNKRSVWTIPTSPFPEAHFATFPPKLVEPCIIAGSHFDEVVLDPFMGSGTVAIVAEKLWRRSIGIELNPEYVEMARARIAREQQQMNMFHSQAQR